jgi:hypothetical protein
MTIACLLFASLLIQLPPAVLLGGQSNAVYLAPVLASERVATVARSSTGIGAWHADGDMWPPTASVLRKGSVRAVVWWQGSSDRYFAGYLGELQELIKRMRAAAGSPTLPVIVVRVLDKPENRLVRRAQEALVATDANATLISTDGLGLGESDHLTPAGYRVIANRIRVALRSHGVDLPPTPQELRRQD